MSLSLRSAEPLGGAQATRINNNSTVRAQLSNDRKAGVVPSCGARKVGWIRRVRQRRTRSKLKRAKCLRRNVFHTLQCLEGRQEKEGRKYSLPFLTI